MQPEGSASVRVGLLILGALVLFAAGIFLIGEQNSLFRPKNHYQVRFVSVGGLQSGNPVQLNGVHVGKIDSVVLPQDPSEKGLIVTLAVDARYSERVRNDSEARLKTLGLLGDKYIELTAGSLDAQVVADGGEIAAAAVTDVDQLLASGEDVAHNIVSISASLKDLLERMESGEGILGELMRRRGPGDPSLADTLNNVNTAVAALTEGFKTGGGPVPRMLHDDAMGEQVASMVARFERLSAELEHGDGTVQTLLRDTTLRDRLVGSVENLEQASEKLATVAASFESGEGLLPKLLNDKAFADQLTGELQGLLERLNALTGKMTEGDGTIAQLLNDPSIYEALNDVVIGIDESKLLRWLVRNRQKAGIKRRVRDAKTAMDSAGEAEGPPDSPPPSEHSPESTP